MEKRKNKKSKTYLKNNEKQLPQFGKGNRYTSPGSTESPKQVGPKEDHTKTHLIKMPKVKDKERILKAAREKQSYLQRSSHKTVS